MQRVCKHKKGKRLRFRFPISMHAGQIIMLTKLMTSAVLRFYEFDTQAR